MFLGMICTLLIIAGVALAFFGTLGNDTNILLFAAILYSSGFAIIYGNLGLDVTQMIIASLITTALSWIGFWKFIK